MMITHIYLDLLLTLSQHSRENVLSKVATSVTYHIQLSVHRRHIGLGGPWQEHQISVGPGT